MAYVELTADQGTSFESRLDLTNDDGTAINVTDYVFLSQIRKSYYSNTPTANITITVDDANNGVIRMSMDPSVTANIKAGRYVYDLKMTSANNVTTRVIEGVITVTPQVSR